MDQSKNKISQVSNDRVHVYDNRHALSLRQIIEELLKRYPNDLNRSISCLTLADLILHNNTKGEFYNRSVYPEGDLFSEDRILYDVYEKEYDIFTYCIQQYLDQSKEGAKYCETNWSIYFLTEYLITELMYHQADYTYNNPKCHYEWFPYLTDKSDYIEEFSKIFYGLYPIISLNEYEISSHMHMKYTQEYNYGFLRLPSFVVENFQKNIPGYLHEIFHYIPPQSRISRNKTAISLFIHAVLGKWRIVLFNELHSCGLGRDYIQSVYDCYYKQLYNYLLEIIQKITNTESNIMATNGTNLDSMLLTITVTYCIYRLSPEDFCRLIQKTTIDNFPSAKFSVIKLYQNSSIMKQLEREWRMAADRYSITYNNLLRELRADISMTLLLDIDLESYIRIMAKEKRFAQDPISIAGDVNILRFGFMTRFLWQSKNKENFIFTPLQSQQELNAWKKECEEIFNKLSKENTTYKTEHIQNLQDYINVYCELAIEIQPDSFYAQYTSPLEEELGGTVESEVNQWIKNVYHIQKNNFPSIAFLKDCYDNRNDPKSNDNVYQVIYDKSVSGLSVWNEKWPLSPYSN